MPAGTGSKTSFGYFAGSGQEYAVLLDESNAESADLALAPPSAAALPVMNVTKGFPVKPRYVNCYRINSDGETVRRRFIVGTAAQFAVLEGQATVTVSGFAYFITSLVGEKGRRLPSIDTGITDGD
jgi:hypothetical protein